MTRTLPNGTVGFSIFVDDYTDTSNSRAGFSLFRALQLPAGALSGSIGATQLEDEDPELTGSLDWQQKLPNSGFGLGLTQAVQNDSDNVPQYVTGLRLDYDRELNPLSQVALASAIR